MPVFVLVVVSPRPLGVCIYQLSSQFLPAGHSHLGYNSSSNLIKNLIYTTLEIMKYTRRDSFVERAKN